MSEEQANYQTQPEAIIDPPRTLRALQDGKVIDYQVWGWVKTSAKFRSHIKILRGAKHDIWHYLALGVDENGKTKETIKQICEGTGYSHTEVINTLRELDALGYLSVQKDSRGNIYTPEFVARGTKSPTETAVNKVDSTPLDSTTVYQVDSTLPIEEMQAIPLELKELINRLLKGKKMKTSKGTDDIAYQLWKSLRDSGANLTKNHLRVMRETLTGLDEGSEEVKSKEWNLAHDFPAELEPIIQRLEKGLGLSNLMRDANAIEVYRWIAGQSGLDRFIEWATSPERVQFIGKYKKNIGLIKVEWKAAAENTTPRTSASEVRF